MARKSKASSTVAFAGETVSAPVPAARDPFWRSILTDHDGEFDAGAVLVIVVALFMCVAKGYDVFVLHTGFDPEKFGFGIAAMLGGFGAYKWGDAKARPTTTITSTSTMETRRPMTAEDKYG